jgi:hypothetical protein
MQKEWSCKKMKHDITPADCDGKCASCPIDDKCDHIRLTDSQKTCAALSFWFFIFIVAAVIFAAVAE